MFCFVFLQSLKHTKCSWFLEIESVHWQEYACSTHFKTSMDANTASEYTDTRPTKPRKIDAKVNGKCNCENPLSRSYSTGDIPPGAFEGRTFLPPTSFEEVEHEHADMERPQEMDELEDVEFKFSDIDSHFSCACCYELMVQPTTLNCGHSFCRLCLAHWWKTSQKTTCPQCRQPWTGFPHVNIIIRYYKKNKKEKKYSTQKAFISYKYCHLLQLYVHYTEAGKKLHGGSRWFRPRNAKMSPRKSNKSPWKLP